jgi:hypothetical protein
MLFTVRLTGSNKLMRKLLFLVTVLAALSACTVSPTGEATPLPSVTATEIPVPPTITAKAVPSLTVSPTPGLIQDTRLPPDRWQEWPVVPASVSAKTIDIYRRGQELGNNPQAFSKIGDCESSTEYFLVPFDGKPAGYSLGSYSNLQVVIDAFHGSYGRTSLAAGKGFTTANLLTSLWADRKYCVTEETPLACEVRVNKPSFALIMLGTNDVYHLDTFEPNMRKILDYLIGQGVVPILATKADNLEKNASVNASIARLAYEYDLPLWNFWLAVQPLPNQGLQEDGSHLTYAQPFFDDPVRMQKAFPWRNLTALQVLNTVWQGVTGQP